MGLDWCLRNKLNPTIPADIRSAVLAAHAAETPTDEQTDLLRQWMLSPLEHLGAKRLDLDVPETVEAFRSIYDSYQSSTNPHWLRPFEDVAAEHVGSVLVNTLPDTTKIAHNLGNPFAVLSGYESFRGKRLQFCELPDEVVEQAFQDMDPDAMLAYADTLEQHFNPLIYAEYLGRYEALRDLTDDGFLGRTAKEPTEQPVVEELERTLEESDFYIHRTLTEAIQWLRFWAEAGFSMHAWY
jgi:hypothetical protein